MLKDTQGRTLAYGDLIQVAHGNRVTSRFVFHFRDGSVDDDTTTYTQQRTFHLVRDHRVQKGPSFPKPSDITIDCASGTVTSRKMGNDGKVEAEIQKLDIPLDVANGMMLPLMNNISFNVSETDLSYIATSNSRSRVIQLAIRPSGPESMLIAGSHRQAMEFTIEIRLGGVAGVIAPVIGKQPDDLHIWVLGGRVPVVVAEEGQLYEGGPIWRIELVSPTWPSHKTP